MKAPPFPPGNFLSRAEARIRDIRMRVVSLVSRKNTAFRRVRRLSSGFNFGHSNFRGCGGASSLRLRSLFWATTDATDTKLIPAYDSRARGGREGGRARARQFAPKSSFLATIMSAELSRIRRLGLRTRRERDYSAKQLLHRKHSARARARDGRDLYTRRVSPEISHINHLGRCVYF